MENAQLHAEPHAGLQELKGSRARILEATATERHAWSATSTTAQQRVVALALEPSMREKRFGDDPETKDRLGQVRQEAATCVAKLRELARGLHPSVVTDHGLPVAVESLAVRCPVHDVDLEERLPEPIEVAAYFLIAESLTNVAKYARATQGSVRVEVIDGTVVVEVADDGVGGASKDGGSGLRLSDRVEPPDGTFRVWSLEGR